MVGSYTCAHRSSRSHWASGPRPRHRIAPSTCRSLSARANVFRLMPLQTRASSPIVKRGIRWPIAFLTSARFAPFANRFVQTDCLYLELTRVLPIWNFLLLAHCDPPFIRIYLQSDLRETMAKSSFAGWICLFYSGIGKKHYTPRPE